MRKRDAQPWLVDDDLWARIEPLLPKQPARTGPGRGPVDDRTVSCGILFVLFTVQALPDTGVGGRLQPCPGAQGRPETGRSPVDRGRLGSKHHLITDAGGVPLAVLLTGGNRNDVTQLIPLLQAIPPIRGKRGRPRSRAPKVYADRGYDHDKYRALVRELGITPVIARRGTEHGSGLGKLRWVVEQSFALLHWFRRLRIRWEIRDNIHEALLKLGCALICWRRLHHSKSRSS